jgi:hypothetical protein
LEDSGRGFIAVSPRQQLSQVMTTAGNCSHKRAKGVSCTASPIAAMPSRLSRRFRCRRPGNPGRTSSHARRAAPWCFSPPPLHVCQILADFGSEVRVQVNGVPEVTSCFVTSTQHRALAEGSRRRGPHGAFRLPGPARIASDATIPDIATSVRHPGFARRLAAQSPGSGRRKISCEDSLI